MRWATSTISCCRTSARLRQSSSLAKTTSQVCQPPRVTHEGHINSGLGYYTLSPTCMTVISKHAASTQAFAILFCNDSSLNIAWFRFYDYYMSTEFTELPLLTFRTVSLIALFINTSVQLVGNGMHNCRGHPQFQQKMVI